MKNRLPIATLLAAAPLWAQATDGLDLATRSKAMAAASALAVSAPTPAHARDPLPEILLRDENERRDLGGCASGATDLCYDLRDGRVVYRGARAYMPRIEGLKAESVSLRHNGISLRYSFR